MQINIRGGYSAKDTLFVAYATLVIDVFRASTTVLALFESGVKKLLVANSLDTIKSLKNVVTDHKTTLNSKNCIGNKVQETMANPNWKQ